MFASILVLLIVLFVAFIIDYPLLQAGKNKTNWMVYLILFSIGFIGVAVYILSPVLPDYLGMFVGHIKPIGA